MKIFDYRTQEVRDLEKKELNIIPPEFYSEIIEVDNKGIIFKYVYKVKKTNKFIDHSFTQDEIKLNSESDISFGNMLEAFLFNNHLILNDVSLIKSVIYMNKDNIKKYTISEEEEVNE